MRFLPLALLFLLLSVSVAAIECGETITGIANSLDQDLDCPGDGITVAAGILDCVGNTLRGTQTGTGIRVTGDNVVITHCNVVNFENGIAMDGVRNILIHDANATGNFMGVLILNSFNVTIEDSTLENQRFEIFGQDSDINERNNTVAGAASITGEFQEPEVVPPEVVPPEIPPEPDVLPPEAPPVEEVPPEEIITDELLSNEELLNRTIYLEYALEDIDDALLEQRLERMRFAMDHISMEREIEVNREGNITTVTLTFIPDIALQNVDIYEVIPKCLATFIDLVVFQRSPDQVLIEDPLIKWHFMELTTRTDLSYLVKKVISDECRQYFQSIAVGEEKSSRAVVVVAIVIGVAVVFLFLFSKRLRERNG